MIERDINKRWEEGMDHHPKSEELFRRLKKIDSDCFWESGGDGDNGETLMYQLDIIFEEDDEALLRQLDAIRAPQDD